MGNFYCSIVRILCFQNFLHLSWNLVGDIFGLIGNSNVKSKIDKNVILLLYGPFLLFYCPNSIVFKLFTFKLKFGRWHIRTIGNSNVKSKIDKNVILLFSKLSTFKLKFGRWHIRTIGNSNVKSKIDKNVILLLYGQFLLFYCPNSIVFKTFYI